MDRVAGGRKGREMRTLIFPTHRWWEPYTHSKLTQPHQQQYRPHIFLTLTLVGHCKCCAPYQANTRAHTDMASADKAVLTLMPMGENDRWLGGTGAVKTDKQWLSPEPPVTEENPISSVWYRKYIDSTCVQSFIPLHDCTHTWHDGLIIAEDKCSNGREKWLIALVVWSDYIVSVCKCNITLSLPDLEIVFFSH